MKIESLNLKPFSMQELQELKKHAENFLLPENFKVFVNGNTVINHLEDGFAQRTLPTFNHYTGENGGYVAIYTRDPDLGVYSVGDEGGSEIYVMGQVRIPGYYDGRIFIPTAGEREYTLGDNITRDSKILAICREYYPDVVSDFWVGGDTGGWFGIPPTHNQDMNLDFDGDHWAW